MTSTATRDKHSTKMETILHLAFELGDAHWKLGFTTGFGRKPRLRTIGAGDIAALEDEVVLAKKRFRLKTSSPVVSCYEAGRDGFWIHRCLAKEYRNATSTTICYTPREEREIATMAKRKNKQQQPELVRRDGGLCVTFVNTGSSKRKSFTTYVDLLEWGLAYGALTGADVERLERAAAERRGDAAEVARRARELRARCQRIFEGLIQGQGPNDSDLDALNAELVSAHTAQRLARSGLGCRRVWGDRGGDDLDRMLWPVVMSMAEVLSTKYHRKVRRCAGQDCDLLFVDRTPGSPRKWCSMKACGNKVNSRRDYDRRLKPWRKELRRSREQYYRQRNKEARETREAREHDAVERPPARDGKPLNPRVA